MKLFLLLYVSVVLFNSGYCAIRTLSEIQNENKFCPLSNIYLLCKTDSNRFEWSTELHNQKEPLITFSNGSPKCTFRNNVFEAFFCINGSVSHLTYYNATRDYNITCNEDTAVLHILDPPEQPTITLDSCNNSLLMAEWDQPSDMENGYYNVSLTYNGSNIVSRRLRDPRVVLKLDEDYQTVRIEITAVNMCGQKSTMATKNIQCREPKKDDLGNSSSRLDNVIWFVFASFIVILSLCNYS